MKSLIATVFCFFTVAFLQAQNGHELWLRPVKAKPVNVICKQNSPTLSIAKQELADRWQGEKNATVTLSIGPQNYGRTHADGANMLADELKPYGGIVMWRAFVYSSNNEDRAKQAYDVI